MLRESSSCRTDPLTESRGGKATVRLALAIAVSVSAVGLAAAPAGAAGSPTCSDVAFLGVSNHGEHVTRDYVGSPGGGEGAAVPGGPGPGFHFPNGVAPGASFCNPQSESPGFHVGG